MVNVNETIDLPYFITNVALAFINLAGWNPLKTITSLLSTDTDIKAQFNLKALPNQESKQIYNGKIFIKKTILFLINVEEPLIDEETLNSSSNMLPLDNASGGVYDIEALITLPQQVVPYVLETEFNFIPTFSSLDIGSGNQTIGIRDLNKAYSPLSPPKSPKNTPFDNFFTNELTNEQHTQFTLNNSNWLMDELKGNEGFFSCASDCSDSFYLTISGAEQVCSSTSETYTINNLSSNASVYWTISPSGAFTLNSNGSSVSVSPNTSFTGKATITAVINSDCNGLIQLKKPIWVGTPKINTPLPGPGSSQSTTFCQTYNQELQNFILIDADGIPFITANSDWEWTSISNNFTFNTYKNRINIIPYQVGPLVFKVRVRNTCGWSNYAFFQYNVVDCGSGGGGQQFRVFPNPTSSEINVVLKENNELNNAKSFVNVDKNVTQLTLYDFYGNVIIDKKHGNLKKLNMSRAKTGIYYLEIRCENKTETHKVVVE